MTAMYSRIRLTTDKHAKDGAPKGSLGYVIESYGDGVYEVEFSDPETGISFAQLVIAEEDLSETPESESPADDLEHLFLQMSLLARQRALIAYAHELTILARMHFCDGPFLRLQGRGGLESLHDAAGGHRAVPITSRPG